MIPLWTGRHDFPPLRRNIASTHQHLPPPKSLPSRIQNSEFRSQNSANPFSRAQHLAFPFSLTTFLSFSSPFPLQLSLPSPILQSAFYNLQFFLPPCPFTKRF